MRHLCVAFFVSLILSPTIQVWAEVKDPVIIIPGILGSKLGDDKEIVWGNIGNMISRFSDLELSLNTDKTQLKPMGLLDSIQVFGPFKFKQYDGLIKILTDLGFQKGTDLFIFPYDWRRSNYYSAKMLKEFVDNLKGGNPKFANKKFTILAHSMGGLVARIYIQNLEGSKSIGQLITMGTPLLGSLEAFRSFLTGLGGLGNFIVGGEDVVKRVIFSFPSVYELLAGYENCCILGHPKHPQPLKKPIKLVEASHWLKYKWSPDEYLKSPRKEFLEKALKNAGKIHNLVKTTIPKEVKYVNIAGDLVPTVSRVYLDKISGKPIKWKDFPGDGTVPEWSSTLIGKLDAYPATRKHATIYNDSVVTTTLRRRLIDSTSDIDKFAFSKAREVITKSKKKILLESINITAPPYQESGREHDLKIKLLAKSSIPIRNVNVEAWLNFSNGELISPIPVSEIGTGSYIGKYVVPEGLDTFQIKVNIPGLGLYEDYFVGIPALKK